jgi:hypothetical protein
MMNVELSQIGSNISNYLELNKALEIDGVGLLTKTYKSCSLSSSNHLFLPGEHTYSLKPPTGLDSHDFILFLSDKLNVSTAIAGNLYSRFVSELIFDLEIKGKSRIPGLGYFYSHHGIYTFERSASSSLDSNYALPVLQLKPLNQTVEKGVSKPAVRNVSSSNDDSGFLAAVAAVAAIFILLVTFYDISSNRDKPISLSNIGIDVDHSRLNQDPEKLLVSEKLSPELIPGVIEEEEKIASCALIIGSFARQSNALEMQQKVTEAGYALFTEDFHGFFRVGVSCECSDIKGASFREIEKTLGVDPWLRIVR